LALTILQKGTEQNARKKAKKTNRETPSKKGYNIN